MLDELCERLGLSQVDVVANDTGGAVSQVFAARYPQRIRTLTLTNCDVHDNFPPEIFKPFVALAEAGEFGPMVAAMAGDAVLARSETGFGMGYAHPDELPDELLTSFLGPFVADQGKGLERFLTASTAAELMAVEPLLAELHAPAQVAWGTGDVFFEPSWAQRLADMIPGVERVTLDSRRHALLARRAGSRPRALAPGLLGGTRLSRRATAPARAPAPGRYRRHAVSTSERVGHLRAARDLMDLRFAEPGTTRAT